MEDMFSSKGKRIGLIATITVPAPLSGPVVCEYGRKQLPVEETVGQEVVWRERRAGFLLG